MLDEDGNPVWVPPGEVTVNGDDLPNSNTPLPPFTDLPDDPTEIDPSLQWMMDQPFTWNGPDFEVPPKKWTTIPFTQPLMERQSNVTGGSTTWFELDWDDASCRRLGRPGHAEGDHDPARHAVLQRRLLLDADLPEARGARRRAGDAAGAADLRDHPPETAGRVGHVPRLRRARERRPERVP